MEASVVLVMTLADRESRIDAAPEPATPAVKLRMDESFKALISNVVPLETSEPEICAVTEFVITFAPIRAPTATAPEPATLTPRERMSDLSLALRSIRPPAVTSDPPSIDASTEFVITLPKPVAFTATAPEPATPIVRAIMPASDRASSCTLPTFLRRL